MEGSLSGWVDTILTVLFVLVGALMTFFILLQEGKGGGLAALGGTKAAGVEGVTNPIRRATGYMAGLFFALAIILGIMHKPEKSITFSAPAAGMSSGEKKDETKTDAPKTDAPKTDAPKTDAPKTEVKTIDAKPADAPKTDAAPAKTEDAAKAAATPVEAPKTEAPKTEEKKPEEKKEGAATPAAPTAPATQTK
jgi:protein translocase SecG subunit